MLLFYCITALLCASCGEKEEEKEVVRLSIWCSEAALPLTESLMETFAQDHAEEADIQYTVSVEGEDSCKETVLSNPQAAADIFCFADDQLDELQNGNALLEIDSERDRILESVGGESSGAARAAMLDGKLYAYPLGAGNGYFLYYNKSYFSEEDLRTLDGILKVAGENGKYFTMDFGSGWYIYSFFKGAGLYMEANEDETANICNWNATDTEYSGVEVAQAMLDISANEAFVDLTDEGFVAGVEDGSVIAGVNGAWNAEKVAAAWGDDYAATKLPTYTLAGDQVQMCSFSGYKLMGINANTAYPEWCKRVAEYLTNEENQLKRFETVGDCPANVNAANTEEVQASPAVAALDKQSAFGYTQEVVDCFWESAQIFGITISSGNQDGRDLQELLDEMVAGITGKAE